MSVLSLIYWSSVSVIKLSSWSQRSILGLNYRREGEREGEREWLVCLNSNHSILDTKIRKWWKLSNWPLNFWLLIYLPLCSALLCFLSFFFSYPASGFSSTTTPIGKLGKIAFLPYTIQSVPNYLFLRFCWQRKILPYTTVNYYYRDDENEDKS